MGDLVLLVSFIALRNWSFISPFLYIFIVSLAAVVGTYLVVIVGRAYSSGLTAPRTAQPKSASAGPKVLFFPGRTTHTRFFPKRHSFQYSYLLVGIPVGWRGSIGGMLSVDGGLRGARNESQWNWFSVDAEDYLDRGHGDLGLDGKLRKYLRDQGLSPEDYPYAYLFTQPKFLGYFNNPVSFWYIYSPNRELKAMILEVNNTFEERRMYLLTPDATKPEALEGTNEGAAQLPSLKPTTFSETWSKDFHVSPFSSRKGFYSLNTSDPLYPSMSMHLPLSGTITLLSSKRETKLVARMFSEGPPVDPATMTLPHKALFVCNWWWAAYLTFPRVAWEAAKLWFKRGLYVWGRPEPLPTSISRTATPTETILESHFRSYLAFLVQQNPNPIHVHYISTGTKTSSPELTFSSPTATNNPTSPTLTLKVLTPIFYTRFPTYAHDLEALFSESITSATISLTNASLLPTLVLKPPSTNLSITNPIDALFFTTIRKLRRRAQPLRAVTFIGKPSNSSSSTAPSNSSSTHQNRFTQTADLRTFRASSMDGFMISNTDESARRSYRWEVLKVVLAERIAFGDLGILGLMGWSLKAMGLWFLVGWVGEGLKCGFGG